MSSLDFSKLNKYDEKTHAKQQGVFLLVFDKKYCYVGKTGEKNNFEKELKIILDNINVMIKDYLKVKNITVMQDEKWTSKELYGKILISFLKSKDLNKAISFDDFDIYILESQNNSYEVEKLENIERSYIEKFNTVKYGFNSPLMVEMLHKFLILTETKGFGEAEKFITDSNRLAKAQKEMDEYIKDTWSDEVFEKYFINGMNVYLGLSVARNLTQFTG